MNEALINTHGGVKSPTDFKRLPISLRVPAAEQKYAEAVAMYAATSLSIRSVAEKCGVTAAGLSAHISKHHRNLLFARYGLDSKDSTYSLKVKAPKGQSLATHLKYKEAIEACGDIAYIEYNVSQVARLFNLDGPALASQLRVHYPDIIPLREALREKLGIADKVSRGARQSSTEAYAEALALYRDTDLTIPEVAERCDVSQGGFSRFLRFYHKDVIADKAKRRKAARKDIGERKPGKLAGNGNLYGPKPETVDQYATALELYRSTSLTIAEIAEKAGVPEAGFKGYLHQWHRGLGNRQYRESTAAKYAPAIASLKEKSRPVAEVAAEFGLNPEVFRHYLKTHEPELAREQGMTRSASGKLVKHSSAQKYAQAIHEYATTAESLKSIAARHGFVYNSLCGYVTRNCPEEREAHKRIVESTLK